MTLDHMTERHGRVPGRRHLLALLHEAAHRYSAEVGRRLEEAGFGDIRPGHGCVFGNIQAEGSRLTDLAELAGFTKQAVGEVASDLERMGYLKRVPDPDDRRAKIIRLTDRGRLAQETGLRIIAEIEAEWEERYGEENVAALRTVLLQVAFGEPVAAA